MRGWKAVSFKQFSWMCSACDIGEDGIRRCYYSDYNKNGAVCANSTCPRWRKIGRADIKVVKITSTNKESTKCCECHIETKNNHKILCGSCYKLLF